MGRATVVLGGGGHGAVALSTALAADFDIVGVFDDRSEFYGTMVMGMPVLRTIAEEEAFAATSAVTAIGDNASPSEVVGGVPLEMVSIIHPAANVPEDVRVREGTVVFAARRIQPSTTIGDHVIVNSGAVVDHDCRVGDFVHIAPGATVCGGVKIGSGVFISAGATIVPGVTVGTGAVLGAGSAVVNDVEPVAVVAGVPARIFGGR